MTITPQMIKELREITGVGIGKCKEALEKAGGNVEEAIAVLRKAGLASAANKQGRAANEGIIATAEKGDDIAIVEINAETDFVVNNERFQDFLKNISEEIVATLPSSLESFVTQKFSKDPSMSIEEYRASIVQAIGENIQIRRFKTFKKSATHSVGVYSHLGGKMVTVVEIDGGNAEDVAKDVAMHVAAAAPEYVSPEEVPAHIIEQEKEIARSQVLGKPDNVREKIVEGKISKFFDDVCLNRQLFIKDDSLKVADFVKKSGDKLNIVSFTRWGVGQ